MIKIRISYQKPEEIRKLLKVLQPFVKHMRGKNAPAGEYKKLYIDIKE